MSNTSSIARAREGKQALLAKFSKMPYICCEFDL